MYVYVIENGTTTGTQKGQILYIYTNEEAARKAMSALKFQAAKFNEIKEGIADNDHEPGVLEGFWYGPKGGNTCAHGYRLQRIWAYDK